MSNANTLIAIPTHGGVHERVMIAAHEIALRGSARLIAATGRPADYTRNGVIRLFLEDPGLAEFTHLLFLDSDTEPPLDALDRLLSLDAPVATGCYPVCSPRGRLVWALLKSDGKGKVHLLDSLPSRQDPFPVDAAGAGCLLVRRDVFTKIPWPWFLWQEHTDGSQRSEDVHFFLKLRSASIPILAHPSVICNHHKEINLTSLMREIQE